MGISITVAVPAQPKISAGVRNIGATGPSSYELAVAKGFEGTLDEWIASLAGAAGESAYELAVMVGFEGTLEEWLDSLHGEDADPAAITAAVEAYMAANPPAPLVHTHTIGEVTGLSAALDARAPIEHSHAQSDVTGLEAALADLAPASHTHTSASVTDFTEAVQDAVAALLAAGTNVTLNYDDAGDTLTVSAAGGGGGSFDAEAARDALGVALVGLGNISIVVNDDLDTITISTTATVNSTDAALRDRSTHTGTQPSSSIDGLATVATSGAYGDLSGKPTLGTAAAQDSTAFAAAVHGHTAAQISDFNTAADARVAAGITGKLDASAAPELIRDTIGTALTAGTNITLTVNDAGDTITIGDTVSPIAAGSANNPHTTKAAARNAALPKNWWRYAGTAPADNPTNWVDGDEWISV